MQYLANQKVVKIFNWIAVIAPGYELVAIYLAGFKRKRKLSSSGLSTLIQLK
jgi:hypothetical protein